MKKKHWYVTKYEICVLCGKEKKVKYRVYEKPKNAIKTEEYACNEHFI